MSHFVTINWKEVYKILDIPLLSYSKSVYIKKMISEQIKFFVL